MSVLARFRNALGYTIPRPALAFFFDGLVVLLHSGQPLADNIVRASRWVDPELAGICETIAPLLRNGANLTDSLKPYADRFPELVLPVLEVGDISGTLEGSARRLADTFNQGMAIDRKFKHGVFDPWHFILGLTMLQFVSLIVTSFYMQITFSKQVIMVAAGTLLTALALIACYLGGRALSRYALRQHWLRLQIDTIKLALPGLGTVFRNLSAARWARSFAVLWGAGIPVSYALEVSSRSAFNSYYERAMLGAALKTREGWTLHKSLSATELLPSHLLSTIAAAETSGHMVELLERQAADMENEAFHRATQEMNKIVVIAQMIVMIIAGVAAFAMVGGLSANALRGG